MDEALLEEQPDVIVGQPIDHSLADADEGHQVAVSEKPELMARSGLRHTCDGRDVAHAELLQCERLQDAQPGGIGERREDVGRALGQDSACELRRHERHGCLVDDVGAAGERRLSLLDAAQTSGSRPSGTTPTATVPIM